MIFLFLFTIFALGATDECEPELGEVIDSSFYEKVAALTEQTLQAGTVCSNTLKRYREAKCQIQDIRGFSNAQKKIGGGKLTEIPGGYLRLVKNCGGALEGVKSASVSYIRKPPRAGNVPRMDECIERQHNPPGYFQRVTRTITKTDPKDYSKKIQFPVIEDFQFSPSTGATLRMVSYTGEEIRCYGGEFDPEAKAEVKYLYCLFQGERISVPRKDQFAVIANGRFSISNALKLPEPPNFQKGSGTKVKPEQIIPTRTP